MRLFRSNDDPQGKRVALVSSSKAFLEGMRNALSKRASLNIVDHEDLRALSSAAASVDVVLLDLEGKRSEAIEALQRMSLLDNRVTVIAFSETLDEHTLRTLLRTGVADWLPSDATSETILAAIDGASRSVAVVRDSKLECIAFVPAAGGVGNTTVAIETAFLLGQSRREAAGICLIDLNFQSGTLADYLDVEPGFDLKAVTASPDRLDSRLLEVMLARHPSGIAVLAAPRAPVDECSTSADLIVQVLDIASQMFEVLVIDMPPMWMSFSDHVISGCDRIFVVTESTVPSLRKARDLANGISGKVSGVPVQVIVNKWRREFFGGMLRKKDAEEVLNGSLAGFLPEDGSFVREAINTGQNLGEKERLNRLSRELKRIVTSPPPGRRI